MQLHELEHLIRAAARITNEYEFIVLGSQSILGSVPRPPAECVMSNEADIFPMNAEDKADLIDGAIGEGSQFHETHGLLRPGCGLDHRQPAGRLAGPSGTSPVRSDRRPRGLLPDVLDLFLSKCAANREKDRVFNRALLAHGYVSVEAALARLPDMPLDKGRKTAIANLISRLAEEVKG